MGLFPPILVPGPLTTPPSCGGNDTPATPVDPNNAPHYISTAVCPIASPVNTLAELPSTISGFTDCKPNEDFANQFGNLDFSRYNHALVSYSSQEALGQQLTIAFYGDEMSDTVKEYATNIEPLNLADDHQLNINALPPHIVFWAEIQADGTLELGLKIFTRDEEGELVKTGWTISSKETETKIIRDGLASEDTASSSTNQCTIGDANFSREKLELQITRLITAIQTTVLSLNSQNPGQVRFQDRGSFDIAFTALLTQNSGGDLTCP